MARFQHIASSGKHLIVAIDKLQGGRIWCKIIEQQCLIFVMNFAGLQSQRRTSVDLVLCTKRHGYDRSHVSVLARCLHWPFQTVHWQVAAKSETRRSYRQSQRISHVRRVQVSRISRCNIRRWVECLALLYTGKSITALTFALTVLAFRCSYAELPTHCAAATERRCDGSIGQINHLNLNLDFVGKMEWLAINKWGP